MIARAVYEGGDDETGDTENWQGYLHVRGNKVRAALKRV